MIDVSCTSLPACFSAARSPTALRCARHGQPDGGGVGAHHIRIVERFERQAGGLRIEAPRSRTMSFSPMRRRSFGASPSPAVPWSMMASHAALGFIHVVRRDEHGDALRRQRVDLVPEIAPRFRIDARRRLVEEQHPRPVYDAAAEVQAALHAAAEALHWLAGAIAEADLLQHLVHAAFQIPSAQAVRRAPVREVVADAAIAEIDRAGRLQLAVHHEQLVA